MSKQEETIRAQVEEIRRLKEQVEANESANRLRSSLVNVATTARIAAPTSHGRLLEMIVETAAHVINAKSASLLLLDESKGKLVFEVALGQKADEVKKFSVPMGHGIAGLVAVSGQAMAVAGAREDPRHASDIAEQIGYRPETILCVPLWLGDRVIGVLELFDKEGGFTPADMEALGLFANLAAVGIEQSRTYRNLGALVGEAIRVFAGDGEQAKVFVHQIQKDATYERAETLAELVSEIASHGEAASDACRAILGAFADYLRQRSHQGL